MQELNLSGIRHAVVVAPHSDDETIAAFHTIKALRQGGACVDVIVVTDGAASHRSSPSWPAPRLIAARQRETAAAMAIADVPQNHITFLGLPDGGLDSLGYEDFSDAVSNLGQGPLPDLIIMPDHTDDHPDHRDVARMCVAAWASSVQKLRYIVWPGPGSAVAEGNTQVFIEGDPTAKRLALDQYQTQLGLIEDDPNGFSLDQDMLDRMCAPTETFAC